MVLYRRNRLEGGTYFFTVTLNDRQSDLLVRNIDKLRTAFRHVRQRHLFTLDAVVVLPEHLHAVMTLPEGDHRYPMRWRQIKSLFSRSLQHPRGHSPWQPRYWEHTIRDQTDLNHHIDYIHFNPVKHGFVDRVMDWPYSSFHRYVSDGLLPADWADAPDASDMQFGEP